jgi:hypothetical protein
MSAPLFAGDAKIPAHVSCGAHGLNYAENLTNEPTDLLPPISVSLLEYVVCAGRPVTAAEANEPMLGPGSMIK